MAMSRSQQRAMFAKKDSGQWGVRRIGKREGTVGKLTNFEASAKPFEFGLGTVWATSRDEARKIVREELNKKRIINNRSKNRKDI